jgi:hypothetical protein
MLERYLTSQLSEVGRKVVFLDEIPWIASPRSGFLSALDHFWNSFGSRQQNLIVVICGSAASWMIVNVLQHKGGLHNRVTRTIPLNPFNLHETESFLQGRGIPLEQDQILELFMAVGGIPYYLDYVRKGKSAAQNIDALFFAPNAPLRDEFDQLYAALFTHHDQHVKVIRELARKRSGLTRQQLRAGTGLPTGGTLTTVLSELERTGSSFALCPSAKHCVTPYIAWSMRSRCSIFAGFLRKRCHRSEAPGGCSSARRPQGSPGMAMHSRICASRT